MNIYCLTRYIHPPNKASFTLEKGKFLYITKLSSYSELKVSSKEWQQLFNLRIEITLCWISIEPPKRNMENGETTVVSLKKILLVSTCQGNWNRRVNYQKKKKNETGRLWDNVIYVKATQHTLDSMAWNGKVMESKNSTFTRLRLT